LSANFNLEPEEKVQARESLTPEHVIAKLRPFEVALSNGKALPRDCKVAAISPQSYYLWRNLPL
jgi:hypothetical protein